MEYRYSKEAEKIGNAIIKEHHPHLLGVRVDEEWRQIPGYEDSYEVSDFGRVRRSGKVRRSGRGRTGGARIGRVLKNQNRGSGYASIQLFKDGVPKMHLVHRLVAAAFLGPCPVGKEVNHIDAIKLNNRPSNLEYVTRAENNRHARRLGLVSMGRGQAKLSAEQVREILAGDPNEPARIVALRYGVSKSAIAQLRSGRSVYYRSLVQDENVNSVEKEACSGV